jgi:AraC-like DNA-binding protein
LVLEGINLVTVFAIAGLSAGAAGLIVYVLAARQRRQLALLLERLAEVEGRLAAAGPAPELPGVAANDDDSDGAPSGVSVPTPSDPLSGKTSYVRRVVSGAGPRAETLAEEALVLVYQGLGESVAAADLATSLNVSLRTLERGISAAFGCTPTQLIGAMKMREARRLLATGACRVSEVALQLDFCNPQHFSRRFKAFYGITPRQATSRRVAP